MSCASSGGASPRHVGRRFDDRRDVVLERAAHLERGEDHRLGPAGRHLAAADLGLLLSVVGGGRTDGELDRLGRALADGHPVAVAHVGLDGGVEVEAPAAQRLHRHDAHPAR